MKAKKRKLHKIFYRAKLSFIGRIFQIFLIFILLIFSSIEAKALCCDLSGMTLCIGDVCISDFESPTSQSPARPSDQSSPFDRSIFNDFDTDNGDSDLSFPGMIHGRVPQFSLPSDISIPSQELGISMDSTESEDREDERRIERLQTSMHEELHRLRERRRLREEERERERERIEQARERAERAREESLQRDEEILQQNYRDYRIQEKLHIRPGEPGWSQVREIGHKLFDTRDQLLELKNSPEYEKHLSLFKAVGRQVKTAAQFYREGDVERGDEYIELSYIILDEVLDPSDGFRVQDHLNVLSDIPIEEWPYQFQMKEEEERFQLTNVYGNLLKFIPNSGFDLGHQARSFGLRAAKEADHSYTRGDSELGEMAFKISEVMLDVTLSFTPIVGLGKDIFEFLSDKNMVTGEDLSTTERVLAGVGILSAGYGDEIASGLGKIYSKGRTFLKLNGKISDLRYPFSDLEHFLETAERYKEINKIDDLKGYATLHEKMKDLPKAVNELKVENIRVGDPNKIAIIGRGMGGSDASRAGVREATEYFRKQGIEIEEFRNPEAWKALQKQREANGGRKLKESALFETEFFKSNKKWAEKLKEEGYTVINLGQNGIETRSPFYDMELEILFPFSFKSN